MFFIIIIGCVSAEVESLGIAKQGECITLKQSCTSCAYVKINAVTYPNKTTINTETYLKTFCHGSIKILEIFLQDGQKKDSCKNREI
jgi:hypothetical protein